MGKDMYVVECVRGGDTKVESFETHSFASAYALAAYIQGYNYVITYGSKCVESRGMTMSAR